MTNSLPEQSRFRSPRQHLLALALSTALVFSPSLLPSAPMMAQSGLAMAAPTVGTTAAVKGQVFVSTAGAERKAKVKDSIQLNDEVLTKDDSALQILLLDSTTFTVGQNCSLVIDKFVYDPDTSVGALSAKVFTGAFRYMSGKIGRNNPINATLATPSGSIGIRGTFLEGIVGPDAVALAQLGDLDNSNANLEKAAITILRGAGNRGNTLDDPGIVTVTSGGVTRTILKPGFAIFTPAPDLPPIGPFKMTAEMREYLDFFLRSEPNGGGENPLDLAGTGSEESGQHQFENDELGSDLDPVDPMDEAIEDGLIDLNDGDPFDCTYPYCGGNNDD